MTGQPAEEPWSEWAQQWEQEMLDAHARSADPLGEGVPEAAEQPREETFPAAGPVELDVEVLSGEVEIVLDADTTQARVTAGPLPTAAGQAWPAGLPGLLNWVGGQVGERAGTEAVRELEIDGADHRLWVRASRRMPHRLVPLSVRVLAPARSRLRVRTGGATVRVDGPAGHADVLTGAGDLRFGTVTADTSLQTGSGTITVGSADGRVRARTGTGRVDLEGTNRQATLTTGSGPVRVGTVRGALLVRTGHGDINLREAAAGEVSLTSGSGDLSIGVPSGVLAELDLHGSRGRVRSELDVTGQRPDAEPALRLHGRTGSGQVTLRKAGDAE